MTGKSVLFVCFGNTCRSPIAQACLKQLLFENDMLESWNVDSAGISQSQVNSPPSGGGEKCMKSHKIFHHVEQHRARQIAMEDYNDFDYILTMDKNNMRDLVARAPVKSRAKLLMLGDYDDDKSHGGIIQDPFCSPNEEDFKVVFQQCWRSCKNFLQQVSI